MYGTHRLVNNSHQDDQKMADQKRANLSLDLHDTTARKPRLSLTDLALLSPTCHLPAPPAGTKLATPTPTQFLFPRSVTEEQEAYAHGFARALEELYRQQGPPMAPGVICATPTTSSNEKSVFCLGNGNTSVWTCPSPRPANSAIYTSSRGGVQPQENSLPITSGVNRSQAVTGSEYHPASLDSRTSLVSLPVSSTQPHGTSMLKHSGGNPSYSAHPGTNAFQSNQQRCSQYPLDGSTAQLDPYSVGNLRQNFSTNMELRGSLPVNPSTTPRFVGTIDNRACGQPMASSSRSFAQLEPMVCSANQPRPFLNIPGTATSSMMPTENMMFPHRPDLPVYAPERSAGFTNIPTTNMDNRPSSTFFDSPVGSYSSSPRPQCIDALDMDEQERLKLERKRAKNRVAAARCQTRKLERIARLEDKVVRLRDQNSKLGETVTSLSQHITRLKEQIIAHANYGCRLMLPQS